ncbi:hypothetical protein [Microbispora sp. NPDC049125]|uniref:hypothetical protein n=1 Tax=Microbispora sp. NPDC049125 TaxID=3154929 RepID=UPI0034657177
MSRRVNVTVIARADGPAATAAVLDQVLSALEAPGAGRGKPERYDKFPGCWLNAAVVGELPGDDAQDVVARLAARLPLTGWHFSGDEDAADAVWDADRAATQAGEDDGVPGARWILIEAAHPPGDEPAQVEDLTPLATGDLTEEEKADIVAFLTEIAADGTGAEGGPRPHG